MHRSAVEQGLSMADKSEADVLAEALKLPLDERVAHSNWKARVAAYEAIKAGCNNVFDPSDPVLGDYGRYHGFAEGALRSTGCSAMQTAAVGLLMPCKQAHRKF